MGQGRKKSTLKMNRRKAQAAKKNKIKAKIAAGKSKK
jgi:hypothetical protein